MDSVIHLSNNLPFNKETSLSLRIIIVFNFQSPFRRSNLMHDCVAIYQKEAREEKWKQTAVFSNESPLAATAFVVNNTTAATTQQSQIHIEAASPSPLDSSFRYCTFKQ